MASNSRTELTAKIIAKANEDKGFRQKLLNDTQVALKEFGINVPEGITVDVLEESPAKIYLVLPVDPADMEIPDAALSGVSGGVWQCGN